MISSVLIGRKSEREWLEAPLMEALAGRGSLVLLAGEAGVGKTRFAEEVFESAEAFFMRGSCSPAAPAYSPVVAAEHGCEVVTLDRDFARFESVRHRRPTAT